MDLIEKAYRAVTRHWSDVVSHGLFFGGLGLVVYGAGMVYPPLRFIVGGAVLFWIARLMQMDKRES